jgi:hypothetical protein
MSEGDVVGVGNCEGPAAGLRRLGGAQQDAGGTTGAPGPNPSGEVPPNEVGAPVTMPAWAKAGLRPNRFMLFP